MVWNNSVMSTFGYVLNCIFSSKYGLVYSRNTQEDCCMLVICSVKVFIWLLMFILYLQRQQGSHFASSIKAATLSWNMGLCLLFMNHSRWKRHSQIGGWMSFQHGWTHRDTWTLKTELYDPVKLMQTLGTSCYIMNTCLNQENEVPLKANNALWDLVSYFIHWWVKCLQYDHH